MSPLSRQLIASLQKGFAPLEAVLPFINIVLICVHSHNVLHRVQLATRAARGNETHNPPSLPSHYCGNRRGELPQEEVRSGDGHRAVGAQKLVALASWFLGLGCPKKSFTR